MSSLRDVNAHIPDPDLLSIYISTISCGLPAAERILWVWEWHEGNEIQSLKFRCLANAKFSSLANAKFSSSANVGPTSLREKHKCFKMIFF